MKRRRSLILTLFCLLLCGLAAALRPGVFLSPGKVLPAHRELPGDCLACHELFHGAPTGRCLGCHPADTIGLISSDGVLSEGGPPFHAHLKEPDCLVCHPEHLDFSAARTAVGFRHDSLQPPVQPRCRSCHSQPRDRDHRYAVSECSCCHGLLKWAPATVDHKKYFRFDSHHKSECAKCHLTENLKEYTCYGCHKHTPAKMKNKHEKKRIYEYEDCAKCHPSDSKSEAKRIWRAMRMKGEG